MRQLLLAGLAAAALLGVTSAAHATFIIDPNPGGAPLLFPSASNVSSFAGNVGSASGPVVDVSTVGNVNADSASGQVSPVNGGVLTELTFTPGDPTHFSDFAFDGQLTTTSLPGSIEAIVTDDQGHPSQTLTFTVTKPDGDFGLIGIVSNDRETIKSVEILAPGTDTFRHVKQIEFSTLSPVPEPASLLLLGSGLLALGALRRFVS